MRFTTSDGLGLHYEDEGAGKVILCLAGLTRNSRDFDFVAPHLGDFRLVRLDYRGRGRSDRDPNHANYNVVREAQDAVELLDHLGLETASVLGTSRGGLVAMAMAALHGDRLGAAILNDVGPVIAPEGIAFIMTYVGKPPSYRTMDEAAAGLAGFFAREFPGVAPAVWQKLARVQYVETADGLSLSYDPKLRDALIAQAEAGPPPDLWPMFEALKGRPAGVIRGANSNLLAEKTLAEMQARLPKLVVGTVPDRGHVPFLDEPEALRVIREVMEQV